MMQLDNMEALRGTFRAEVRGLLQDMERSCRTLESPRDAEGFKGLFRAVHTLQGNCRMMGFPEASELVHAVERVLQLFVARDLPPGTAVASLLLQSVEALRLLLGEPGEGRGRTEVDPTALQERLLQLVRTGVGLGRPDEVLAAPPRGRGPVR
ncbi:two-component system, chemotaxis family, sensor kinase CheA [Stigmatella aurantiaca]|uniref:Two-component system, chemotaxis family, sensor kinase CheA n=1 Tax=Stigmatella aurantiaca TaxID=41 RepID=A0A1H7N457_STIAU|nr:Hpt domain-containing protein [Stigmatella aurantiaca]SEL18194.1 two-component system, chemotaxis family, sensor kinase CheA [Stigmatella aurantiaca]